MLTRKKILFVLLILVFVAFFANAWIAAQEDFGEPGYFSIHAPQGIIHVKIMDCWNYPAGVFQYARYCFQLYLNDTEDVYTANTLDPFFIFTPLLGLERQGAEKAIYSCHPPLRATLQGKIKINCTKASEEEKKFLEHLLARGRWKTGKDKTVSSTSGINSAGFLTPAV